MKFTVPKECFERSYFKTAICLMYSSLLWIGPIVVIGNLWQMDISLAAKLVPAFLLGPVAGYGMYLGGFIGHDGFHFTLHKNKFVSCLLGILFSCFKFPFMITGFALTHWDHHRYLASEKDPDVQIFGKFDSLWKRIFLARPAAFLMYVINTFKITFGTFDRSDFRHPITYNQMRVLGAINILATLGVGAFYIYLSLYYTPFFLALLFANGFGLVISGLGPYLEHAGTDHRNKAYATRTLAGPWWDMFYVGSNYHIEHHLYPTIPFYNLKKAYRALREQGYYDDKRPVAHGIMDSYQFALGKHPYA